MLSSAVQEILCSILYSLRAPPSGSRVNRLFPVPLNLYIMTVGLSLHLQKVFCSLCILVYIMITLNITLHTTPAHLWFTIDMKLTVQADQMFTKALRLQKSYVHCSNKIKKNGDVFDSKTCMNHTLALTS